MRNLLCYSNLEQDFLLTNSLLSPCINLCISATRICAKLTWCATVHKWQRPTAAAHATALPCYPKYHSKQTLEGHPRSFNSVAAVLLCMWGRSPVRPSVRPLLNLMLASDRGRYGVLGGFKVLAKCTQSPPPARRLWRAFAVCECLFAYCDVRLA